MISAASGFTTANAELAKAPIFIITVAGYSRVFTNTPTGISGQVDWLESYDDLSIQISELDGGADIQSWSFTVADGDLANPNAITASFPSFVFEGKGVTVTTGFVGMSQADFALLFTGTIDTVASNNDNLSYTFTCIDNQQILTNLIFTVADDGKPTDNSHVRTLNGHPLDLFIAALTIELGVSSALINEAHILAYRDGLWAGVQFEFEITSPPQAKDFLETQLLRPLGGYMWTNNQGQIDINFLRKDPCSLPGSVLSLNEHNMICGPLARQVGM